MCLGVSTGTLAIHSFALPGWCVESGQLDVAIAMLRVRVDGGEPYAAWRLAELLMAHNRIAEALAQERTWALLLSTVRSTEKLWCAVTARMAGSS